MTQLPYIVSENRLLSKIRFPEAELRGKMHLGSSSNGYKDSPLTQVHF